MSWVCGLHRVDTNIDVAKEKRQAGNRRGRRVR